MPDEPPVITVDASGLTGTKINPAAHDPGVFSRNGLDPAGEITGIPPKYDASPEDVTGRPVNDPDLDAHLKKMQEEQAGPKARRTTTPREIIREGAKPLFTSTTTDVGQKIMVLRLREMVTTGANLSAREVAEVAEATPAQTGRVTRPTWRKREVNGRTDHQRDDLFDPKAVDDFGDTNLERRRDGKAPIGYDGNEVNLHHLTQEEPGWHPASLFRCPPRH